MMDVVCLGLMVCDILVKPVTRDTIEKETSRVEFVKMSSGGDAFNVSINLAKLGISSGIIGKIGNDGFGKFLMDTAVTNKVNTKGIAITEDYGTSTSIVMIHPDGERSFAYYGGATDQLAEEDIDFQILDSSKFLSVGSAFGLPELDGASLAGVMKRARESGCKTVLDVAFCPDENSLNILKPALEYTDIFIPSYSEAKGLTGKKSVGEIAGDLLAYGVQTVVIKMGKDGCYIQTQNEKFAVPAFSVDVVDTTGAGDSFVAGFLAAYTKGWQLHECGRFANAAGALSVQSVGATTGMKSFEEVQAFMEMTVRT